MRVAYKAKRFREDKIKLLRACSSITRSYAEQGLRMTLRQLYYQLVSRDIIPNEEKSYKNLGTLVSDARLAGYIDWDLIEDRVRRPVQPPEFESLADLIEAAVRSYRLPRMARQPRYVELWVEKDALAGVLEPIAMQYHVTLMVNRGYSSQSAMYRAAGRIDRACRDEAGAVVRDAVVLYLGDLDPSGEDMVRDVEDRLNLFLSGGYNVETKEEQESPSGTRIETYAHIVNLTVEKLALTMGQVKEYNPPPNPAKLTDSRAAKFVAEHGYSSWEVDALPPTVLRQVIEDRFRALIDLDKVDEVKEREKADIERLRSIVEGVER